ncbi:MAG: membrane protein insertase YidC [Verrucomicrobia bacterium]|nr:membrane protein insertase YidC [Verrucomicrobiota bacterium]
MDKRGLVIVVICFAVVFGWQAAVSHFWPAPPPGKGPAAKAGLLTNVVTRSAPPLEMKAAPAKPALEVVAAPATPSAPKAPEKTVTLENKLLRAELTTYGGGIRDVLLKEWKVSSTNQAPVTLNRFASEPVFALTGGSTKDTNGVVSVLAWPGADSNAVYTLTDGGPDRVVFTSDAAGGLRIVKEFALGDDYSLTCRVRIENNGKQAVETPALGVAVGTAAQLDAKDDATYVNADHWEGGVSYTGRAKATYTPASSMVKADVFETVGAKWAAVKNRYFALVLSPKEPARGFHARKADLPQSLTPAASTPPVGAHAWLLFDGVKVDAGASVTREFQLYAGPKEYSRLAALGNKQEEVMEFGWFGRIAEVLLWSLTSIYKVIPNYGIAIIIITIVIKLLFWPIQAMSTRSMKRMQELQPLIAKLKEKYPDEPQKQQQEMMKLYKEHKVNPMGGCLPLVAQIPVFIALYNMLRTVIELRGAKFLWINDLSLPDTIFTIAGLPINPLPLVMCATTLWQQKLTPTTSADPTQQKMMMLMPLMFVFMFYSMSSGLVLYWTVQNLLSILQQWLALRDTKKPGATPAPIKR